MTIMLARAIPVTSAEMGMLTNSTPSRCVADEHSEHTILYPASHKITNMHYSGEALAHCCTILKACN